MRYNEVIKSRWSRFVVSKTTKLLKNCALKMVWLNKFLLANISSSKPTIKAYRKQSFLDSLRIFVKGGAGGNGLPKFGGIGGQGGNVLLRVNDTLSLHDVLKKYSSKRIVANSGKNSSHNFILGPPGQDIIVEVPIGVTVYTDEQKKLGELNATGQELIAAYGGTGGHPKNGYFGVIGQAHSIRLDLKLLADVGLVGFPNAGKSTLLKAISHAKPKIANYPFTTIKPNVGQIMYKDLRQISVADLPGLIEGAHVNKGMGHNFLRHIERTKLLLLVADINGFQLGAHYQHRNCLDTIILLNKELEMYNKELVDKPTMLIVNKMDTEGSAEKLNAIMNQIQNLDECISDYPEEMRPSKALRFEEIIPLSAKQGGDGIEYVKFRLRKLLDAYAEKNALLDGLKAAEDESKIKERAKKLV